MKARLLAAGAIALTMVGIGALPAMAAVTPAKQACSNGAEKYACLSVNRAKAPVGATVVFRGTLSAAAMKNLASWTDGTNVVCLDRYAPAPAADGSWPGTAIEGACAAVRASGAFVIKAEFGRVGAHFYGVSMGPCLASEAECGNGDPGLIGVGGPTAVRVTTTR